MKRLIVAILVLLIILPDSSAQISQNWRGPERMGIYHETGLLQEWPDGGPEMIWASGELGAGFSSPVFYGDKIYITGLEGITGFLYVLSADGRMENKYPYGPDWNGSRPGSRSTPAVSGERVYIVSALGKLVCMDPENGEIEWSHDLFNDFDGDNISWGLTENLIVDQDIIYCSPGGSRYNIVALDRYNGNVIWASKAAGGLSAYCSPLLVDHYGKKMLITMMASQIVGLDAVSGDLLWSYYYENSNNNHPNSPVYYEGSIFAVSGDGAGGVKLKINQAGNEVTREWLNTDMDTQMGGVVLVDGYIYGSGHRNRFWFCIDWDTGETVYRSRDIDKGTLIYADGRLYCYTERGELALLEPTVKGFVTRGQTRVTLGSDEHWAHPVINKGILYVRRGNALLAYGISQ